MPFEINKISFYVAVVVLTYLCWGVLFPDKGKWVDARPKALNAARLKSVGAKGEKISLKDPFGLAPVTAAAAAPSTANVEAPRERPIPSCHLEGIFQQEGKPVAFINGVLVREKSRISGAKVIRIEDRRVFLTVGSTLLVRELNLPSFASITERRTK